jgi:hypothetical protein
MLQSYLHSIVAEINRKRDWLFVIFSYLENVKGIFGWRIKRSGSTPGAAKDFAD